MTADNRTALERRLALTDDPVEQYARMVEIIRAGHQHDKRVGKRSSSPHPLDIG